MNARGLYLCLYSRAHRTLLLSHLDATNSLVIAHCLVIGDLATLETF